MEPIKFIWNKEDTFDSIHKKLLGMKGATVIHKGTRKSTFTLFHIGDIQAVELTGLGAGFVKFLEGDEAYQLKDGGYNFEGLKASPMWGFVTEYGTTDDKGNTCTQAYNFMIPRESTYEEDSRHAIVVDDNHPFIFYDEDIIKRWK